MLLAFSVLTGYSTLPLRFASGLGFITSLFGLAMFLYVVVKRLLQTNYVPGFAFTAAEIALFAGLQLFAIGVNGGRRGLIIFLAPGDMKSVLGATIADLAA